MKRSINRAAINKTAYSSAYVGALSYHIFQIKEEGAYVGHVIYKNEIVKHIMINASKEFENIQLNIDFKSFNKHSVNERFKSDHNIRLGGYLLLMNSSNDTAFRFQLEKVGRTLRSKSIFETQKLNAGDLYACNLLRPGTYEVSYNKKKAAIIEVIYPTSTTKRTDLTKAVRVQVQADGIKPKNIKILPMQGLVFEFKSSGAIEIKLSKEEKFRGINYNHSKKFKKIKKDTPLSKYRWRNPKYSKSE